MEKIIISTTGYRSEILVGEKWESAFTMPGVKISAIVTDENVKRIYGHKFPDVPVLSVNPGEDSKKLEVIEMLASQLLTAGIDRSGFILAIGGGVVCDIAGFLAAIFMRGIRCGYVSTTLLSQVDASTGGKNGVNLGSNKNMLGTIRQPEFVVCDPEMLLTLQEEEYLSGLAELIKTAVIGDRKLFDTIEKNSDEILARETDLLVNLVSDSVRFKGKVVSEDENETGLRRILNFGHTFGHAIEMLSGVRHGYAVASGMVLATEFSFEKGLITIEEKNRITDLLNLFNLADDFDISYDQMQDIIIHDKKKSGSGIYFVFTAGIGEARVEKVPVEDVLDFYKRFSDKKYEL